MFGNFQRLRLDPFLLRCILYGRWSLRRISIPKQSPVNKVLLKCRPLAIPALLRIRGLHRANRNLALLAGVAGTCSALLLDASCSTLNPGDKASQLLDAAQRGDIDAIRHLVGKGANVNGKHSFGWYPIHVAAANGYPGAVVALVELGADIDAADQFSGSSSIRQHSQLPPGKVEKGLFERDKAFSALNNAKSFRGCTALHYAVLANNMKLIKALLEAGADPTIPNKQGHIPIDYTNSNVVRQLLEDYVLKFKEIKRQRDLEMRRKFPLEERLNQRIVGQQGAKNAVSAAIRRKENEWYDDDRPLVMLFLGSSGIGKTELAKQVAAYLHKNNAKGFIRLDMSEYQNAHEVAKFIGSPPGYVGHDSGGQLTKRLKECPDAVVLFDEVDKAHRDILTIMLQLFDEGRLTDGKGDTVNCKRATFIMTANLGNREIAAHATQLRTEAEKLAAERRGGTIDQRALSANIKIGSTFKETVIEPILKKHFKRDEFLGRITEIVYFLPFSTSELKDLGSMELDKWSKRAKEVHNINLTYDRHVLDLITKGYNVNYGARSIKHEVERIVVSSLALAHERGEIGKDSEVHVYVDGATIKDSLTKPAGDANLDSSSIRLRVKKQGQKKFFNL